jgi:formylglycine-generating enzyme required for sulfatase activity
LVDNDTSKLTGLSRANTFIFDTVSVKGLALGSNTETTKVYINDSDSDLEIIYVSQTEVKFVPKKVIENGTISLEINDIMTNSLTINIHQTPYFDTVMVEVGKFEMGALSGFSDETPIHEVSLTRDLIVFTNEVTRELWKHAMDSVVIPVEDFGFPADSITWLRAIEFSNRMSDIYGFDRAYTISGPNVTFDYDANGWRLPTEAEWEYICKAGTDDDFSGNGDINQMGYFDSNSGLNSHKVGEKLINQYGLYDIHGNMWEWCWDRYESDYYINSPSIDPTGPETGSRHVMRGGSYQDGFNFARVTNRTVNKIDYKSIGLRLVRNAQ